METIIQTRVGSHCHGTDMPESDQDIREVYIPTIDHFLGLKRWEMDEIKNEGKDIELWNISKLIRLLLKGNPSALNILFADKKDILFVNKWGQRLLDVRGQFLSKRTITAIIGYCVSQLHKLTIGRGTKKGKRSQMIEKYGYDVKFCYHAVMLTRMGIELAKTGTYRPMRSDFEQQLLKKFRRGKVSLTDIRHEIRENLETIKILEPLCPLSDKPNEFEINKWLVNFFLEYYQK